MKKSVFVISKMDCPSEERIIRMRLEGQSSIKQLSFNIPDRTLSVLHEGAPEDILSQLQPLNFGTILKSSEESSETMSENHETEASVLKLLFALNFIMFIVELGFGLFADSIGLISDSLDMLADSSVYLISLLAVGKSHQRKKFSAKVNGYLQIFLGLLVLAEAGRRFIYVSDPEPQYMIYVSLAALCANIYCLLLLSGHQDKGVHLQASYICSSTDVMANTGVILAGLLVWSTHSHLPDLIIGAIVSVIVLRGAYSILRIAA